MAAVEQGHAPKSTISNCKTGFSTGPRGFRRSVANRAARPTWEAHVSASPLNLLLYLLAMGAGVSFVVQQAVNSNLRAEIGSAWWAGFVSYLGGTLAMLVMIVVLREPLLSAPPRRAAPGCRGRAASSARSISRCRSSCFPA